MPLKLDRFIPGDLRFLADEVFLTVRSVAV